MKNEPRKGEIPYSGYVCRNCNIPGHYIQFCPNPKDKSNTMIPQARY